MYRAIIRAAMAAAVLWATAVTVILLSANGEYGEEEDAFAVDMVFVRGGTFLMGCTAEQSDCNEDEKPARSVTVEDFFIARYECTQELWKAVMGSNPSKFEGGKNLPVESVSWDDVRVFIRKLNKITGKEYRLPTEAEWEYAARGGNRSGGYEYSGGNSIDDVAWYSKNSDDKTHPVGTKAPNELGLYDMTGNVWEWTSDYYGAGSRRVTRGGSWYYGVGSCRVSYRYGYETENRYDHLGLRLAFSPRYDNVGFRLAR